MTPPASIEEKVWEALRSIPDPEFGVSIVDLGLVYSVDCSEGAVRVVMTLTTPSCPAGSWIYEGVKEAVARVPGVQEPDVTLAFEPPWNPSMVNEAGRAQLGWAQ